MPPSAIAGGGLCERKELFFKRPLPFFTLLPIIDPMINIMPELTSVFTAYEALVAEADAVFARVGEMHPDCVTCKPGCSDCCHAMFDLSLVEAMYLNARFIEKYDFGPERSRILENAGSVDRKLTRMKRDYFRELRDAKGSEDAMEHIMEEAAKARIRCPLLDLNDQCVLYDYRPITCRLYGIPTAIGGKGHVCGQSNFAAGASYPTVHLDKIQERLDRLSVEIRDRVQSRFKELHEVFVPVSMALLTNYDDAYLGIGPAPKES